MIRMKILITGSTGFIGKNLKEQLSDSFEIVAPSHQRLDLLNINNVEKVKQAGANIIVAGTAIIDSEDFNQIINELKK